MLKREDIPQPVQLLTRAAAAVAVGLTLAAADQQKSAHKPTVEKSTLANKAPVKRFKELNLRAIARVIDLEVEAAKDSGAGCPPVYQPTGAPVYTNIAGKAYEIDTMYIDTARTLETDLGIANVATNTRTVSRLFYTFYGNHRYNLTAKLTPEGPTATDYHVAMHIPRAIPAPTLEKCS